MNYTRESIKQFWMYCERCGYEITGVYFNPQNCPKCRHRLNFLYLRKWEWEKFEKIIADMGCKKFVRKHMSRETVNNENS
jgi:hypothetical protein